MTKEQLEQIIENLISLEKRTEYGYNGEDRVETYYEEDRQAITHSIDILCGMINGKTLEEID